MDSGVLDADDGIRGACHLGLYILPSFFGGGGCRVSLGLIYIVGVSDVFPGYPLDVTSGISSLRHLDDGVVGKVLVFCLYQCRFDPVIFDNCLGLLIAEFKGRVNVGGEGESGIFYLNEIKTPPLQEEFFISAAQYSWDADLFCSEIYNGVDAGTDIFLDLPIRCDPLNKLRRVVNIGIDPDFLAKIAPDGGIAMYETNIGICHHNVLHSSRPLDF